MKQRHSPINPSIAPDQADYSQPVAYDVDGRPLYAHPPLAEKEQAKSADTKTPPSMVTVAPESYDGESFDPRLRKQYANEPNVVHAKREIDPPQRTLSDRLQSLHDRSKKRYPALNLSAGEHVIIAVHRHPIGLFLPIVITGLVVLAMLVLAVSYPLLQRDGNLEGLPGLEAIVGPAVLVAILVGLGGYVAVWVYLQNKFYMTNESVIQEIQHSLFARREQTVSLGSIEDASYHQSGILQLMFNYGSIRLSTEGEETTYRFQFVSNPKRQIAILNNAVEAFKNGRPVTIDDDNA